MDQENRERRKIDEAELGKPPAWAFRAFRENQSEMQQQSRGEQLRQDFDPIDLVIESIQLPAVMERIENERHQAKNVEVHRARRIPAACKNEKSDEEINQADIRS